LLVDDSNVIPTKWVGNVCLFVICRYTNWVIGCRTISVAREDTAASFIADPSAFLICVPEITLNAPLSFVAIIHHEVAPTDTFPTITTEKISNEIVAGMRLLKTRCRA